MRVLGIETSCDETGVGIYDGASRKMVHYLHSQIPLHARHGGVVPELASRAHVEKITPITEAALSSAGLSFSDIDAISYTRGPGLMGALLVGGCYAKALAYAHNLPCIGVHHLEAHLAIAQLEHAQISYPYLGLLISGGHTQLLWVEGISQIRLLGETLDDAVGEAFDKTAKLMGLPYPGGPHLSKLASDGTESPYRFPRPMVDRPGLDFSFSGLKTYALNTFNASSKTAIEKAYIAHAFEVAVCETLSIKCLRAIKAMGAKQLVVAGGVSANQALRQALFTLAEKENISLYFPSPEYCTDNGAMVAYLGFLKLSQGHAADECWSVDMKPRWPISEQ